MPAEVKRILVAAAGIAAIVLGLVVLINNQATVTDELAGGVIAAGAGIVFLVF